MYCPIKARRGEKCDVDICRERANDCHTRATFLARTKPGSEGHLSGEEYADIVFVQAINRYLDPKEYEEYIEELRSMSK